MAAGLAGVMRNLKSCVESGYLISAMRKIRDEVFKRSADERPSMAGFAMSFRNEFRDTMSCRDELMAMRPRRRADAVWRLHERHEIAADQPP